jgi:hypothetical protein
MTAHSEKRGQWIVCVRDVPAGEDRYLGPFASEEKAQGIAHSLRRDFAAVAANDTIIDAIVEWVQPGSELVDVRDELLAGLEEVGYVHTP